MAPTARRCALAALAVLLLVAGDARAQTEPAEDAPELAQQYDAAFDALVRGDLDVAIAGFDAVAQGSVDPDRRAAARELARLARAMRARAAAALDVPAEPPPETPAAGAATAAPADAAERSGRTEFVIMTTIASTYSGFVLIDLLDADDFRSGTLVVTGATAAGFLGSFFGSRGRDITNGMADSYSTGLILGATNAALLASPLGFEDRESILSFVLGGTAVGGASAMLLADRVRPTRMHPTLTMNLAFAGVATVGWGMAIIQPDDLSADTVLTLIAGGLDAGALAGILLSSRIDWSYSRARYVGLGTFLGALSGFAAGAILIGDPGDASDNEGRLIAATTLGGLWAGFGLTAYLTRDMAPGRHTTRAGNDTFVVPAVVGGGPGLGVAGTF